MEEHRWVGQAAALPAAELRTCWVGQAATAEVEAAAAAPDQTHRSLVLRRKQRISPRVGPLLPTYTLVSSSLLALISPSTCINAGRWFGWVHVSGKQQLLLNTGGAVPLPLLV